MQYIQYFTLAYSISLVGTHIAPLFHTTSFGTLYHTILILHHLTWYAMLYNSPFKTSKFCTLNCTLNIPR